MDNKNKPAIILGAVVFAMFLFGIFRLFNLGFEFGEAYPPYSSFRADPMGVRAFYGSLGSLRSVEVQRNMAPVSKIGNGKDKTLLIFGANTSEDPEDVIESLESFISEGGRLVITFFPLAREPIPWYELEEEIKDGDTRSEEVLEDDKESDEPEKENSKDKHPFATKLVSIEDRWGFSYSYSPLPGATDSQFGEGTATKESGADGLPESISWHSALYFDELDEAWQVLYSRDKSAVIMERPWGKGSIALAGDSYFVSNEAMREERHPGLLAWLVGSGSTVIFDEAHLGVQEARGTMTLVRKYRLHGVLGVFFILAGLFIWKNSMSFTPRHDVESPGPSTSSRGRDSVAGLNNLLRRSISSSSVLSVCALEWRRSFAHDPKGQVAKDKEVKAVINRERALPIRQRDPVRAYQTICKILERRN